MQLTTIKTFARKGAAPLGALILLGLLAGCGSGGGTVADPTASPTPSASPVAGVTAQFYEILDPAYAGRAAAKVKWSAPTFTPVANIVEYHIYRNNVIQGVTERRQTTFIDADGETFAGAGIYYYLIGEGDNTKLTQMTAYLERGLIPGVSVTYRVTALYKTPETAASATPQYAETEIGTSNTLTPEQ